MSNGSSPQYDVVIVGAGVSGNLIALELGLAGKKVLILEAGPAVPDNREEYMENFYLALAKTPESPYPALAGRTASLAAGSKDAGVGVLPDPSKLATPRATVLSIGKGPDQSHLIQPVGGAATGNDQNMRKIPFSSTYERVGGGTAWHWLGTSLRLVPHDLTMKTTYGVFHDWPISYDELQTLYGKAEREIGVSASVAQQAPLQQAIGLTYPAGYQYPLNPIPSSVVDQTVSTGTSGLAVVGDEDDENTLYDVFVSNTPAGRNSEPYQDRRVCAGNTNCIPICPIQAKWDPTVTLGKAQDTGNVTMSYQSVAVNVAVDGNNVTQIDYLVWTRGADGKLTSEKKSVSAKKYVLAAHAIENAKLLLLSNNKQGIANSSDQVGRNLMDHVLYLAWALSPTPVFGYRGPLATGGIESLRDGKFRSKRSAFRMEIGNEGWNFSAGDPYTTALDWIQGTNNAQTNPDEQRLGGLALVTKLNSLLTTQFRFGCLLDQSPQEENRVTLDPTITDGLGIPRPKIDYGLDEYTMEGFAMAAKTCSAAFAQMGATEFTRPTVNEPPAGTFPGPGDFVYKGKKYHLYGAGHIMGTHRMGKDPKTSVVDASQKSHDVQNLWIVGSGSFPTVGTANPTLTIVALAFKSADSIIASLA
ncbi:MAG TPA: GMC family oxidoreductase [Thermoanaerobaculia bacterium]